MEKISLTADSVCAIIKQCAASGVTELVFGELSVKFGGWRQGDDPYFEDTKVSPERLAKQEAVATEELEREEVAHKFDELAHTLVEDPSAFEELLVQGELTSSTVGDEPDVEDDSGPESALQRS